MIQIQKLTKARYGVTKDWDINWEYWKKKKKLWRDYKNENKDLVDAVYEWWWNR